MFISTIDMSGEDNTCDLVSVTELSDCHDSGYMTSWVKVLQQMGVL